MHRSMGFAIVENSLAMDARLTPAEEKADSDLIGRSRATGRSLADYLTSTSAVRQHCRSNNISRAAEAYVVEGFKAERKRRGLSENV